MTKFILLILGLIGLTNTHASDLTPAQEPEGLVGIWSYLIIANEFEFAVFNDGTFTYDIVGVFGKGITQSRQQNPEDWGEWRVRQVPNDTDVLELKKFGENSFRDYLFWFKHPETTGNITLNHCYDRFAIADGGPIDQNIFVGASKTWCFLKEGYFANKTSTFGSAPGVGITNPGSILRGKYRIDGRAMKLLFDDGTEETIAFTHAITSSIDKQNIRLNGTRYRQGISTIGIEPPPIPQPPKAGAAMSSIINLLLDGENNTSKFIGNQTIKVTENGTLFSNTTVDRFVMTITNNNTVNISDEASPPSTASGIINNNNFVANGERSVEGCQFSYRYTGGISGRVVNGNVTGNILCLNNQQFFISGSFTAQQQ